MAGVPGALYFAHMRDGPMIRIRLPGGRASAAQLRAIAHLAKTAGNDRVALTNLSNFQVRGLEWIGFSNLKRHLDAAHLLPKKLWADRRRNILGDPLSGLVAGELYATDGLIDRLDAALQAEPLMKASSLKFGFVVDGGGPSHIGAQLHDAALVAEPAAGGVRFRLYLTGRATPFTAAPEDAPALALAAAKAALSFPGRRDSNWLKWLKKTAYKKLPAGLMGKAARPLLALAGPQDTRIRRLLDHVPLSAIVDQTRSLLSPGEFEESAPPDGVPALAPRIGIVPQKDAGRVLCGFGVPLGRLDSAGLERIAALAEAYGTGELRLAPWHVVFIPHVAEGEAEALLRAAEEAGFSTSENFLRFDMSACSGRSGCRGARLETQDHALAVMQALDRLPLGKAPERLSLHVSGCPKGCAHRLASDILALEREDASGYYVYEDSSALKPDLTKRFNGSVPPDQLGEAISQLVRQRGLASAASSGHNPPDMTAD